MASADLDAVRALTLRAKAGDGEAYGELVRRYQDAAYRLALRITLRAQDAEDAAQEAFVRAYQALTRFDVDRPFGPWILKIAANQALKKLRGRRPTASLEEADMPAEESREKDADGADAVRRSLAELEPADRAILALHYEERLKLAEIAAALGIREGAAKVRLFRARARLMERLEEGEQA